MPDMYFYSKNIVFQEVPNEISLSFSIAGCPNNCKNCSWKNCDKKESLLDKDLYLSFLNKYKSLATCVLFLGGEWVKETLIDFLKTAKDYGYKTCLYTGKNDVSNEIKEQLDYLKVGPYIEELGGLASEKTNQKFIDLKTNKILNKYFINRGAANL